MIALPCQYDWVCDNSVMLYLGTSNLCFNFLRVVLFKDGFFLGLNRRHWWYRYYASENKNIWSNKITQNCWFNNVTTTTEACNHKVNVQLIYPAFYINKCIALDLQFKTLSSTISTCLTDYVILSTILAYSHIMKMTDSLFSLSLYFLLLLFIFDFRFLSPVVAIFII